MAARDYMISYREERGFSVRVMAKHCRISEGLLQMLEEDDREVTHPNIAKRIGRKYNLTRMQTEMLMPINHRKHGPAYDPDKYKVSEGFIVWQQ